MDEPVRRRAVAVTVAALLATLALVGDALPADRITATEARRVATEFFRSQNERRYDDTCRLFARGFLEAHGLRDRRTCAAVLRVAFVWSGRIEFRIGEAASESDRFVVEAVADGAPGRLVLVREQGNSGSSRPRVSSGFVDKQAQRALSGLSVLRRIFARPEPTNHQGGTMNISTLTKRTVVLLVAVAATAPVALASGQSSSGRTIGQSATTPATQCPCNAGLPAISAEVRSLRTAGVTSASSSGCPCNTGLPGGPAVGTRVQIPASLANFREPGSTGYVAKTTLVVIPSRFKNFHEPGSTGFVPTPAVMTVTSSARGGLDWVSALIGAGAALGVALAGTGAVLTVRKRRTVAHV